LAIIFRKKLVRLARSCRRTTASSTTTTTTQPPAPRITVDEESGQGLLSPPSSTLQNRLRNFGNNVGQIFGRTQQIFVSSTPQTATTTTVTTGSTTTTGATATTTGSTPTLSTATATTSTPVRLPTPMDPMMDANPTSKIRPCCPKHDDRNALSKFFSAFSSSDSDDDDDEAAEKIPLLSKGKQLLRKGTKLPNPYFF
jgi:hypothetical protein